MKANRSETTGTWLKYMNYYQPGMCNPNGSEILSDFESLLSRVAWFSSASYRGTQNLGSRLKWSLVTEGHLFIFLLFCSRDYLQITNEKNQVFGKYCGHKTGKTVLVSGKYTLIKVHSNRRIQKRGFLISFTAVVPPCKKWYFTESRALFNWVS